MRKLKALSLYLIESGLFDRDDYDSWAEAAQLIPINNQLNESGAIHLFDTEYDAVISIESFSNDANLLFSTLMLWLINENYDFDELGYPAFDVEMEDDDSATVEIKIRFAEEVKIVPSDTGEITLKGVSYTISEPEINTAETFEITSHACTT